MRVLNPSELERLIRSHRRLKISLLLTLPLLVGLLVLLVVADTSFPSGLGVPLGVVIGGLLVLPQRRLLRQLGITRLEARAILEAERERRSGVAALPPAARAERETLRARIFLCVGLALVAVLGVAASYFFSRAGQPVAEDAPTDPWFGISFFAGFTALCAAPGVLVQASRHRKSAAAWRERAAEQPSAGGPRASVS